MWFPANFEILFLKNNHAPYAITIQPQIVKYTGSKREILIHMGVGCN